MISTLILIIGFLVAAVILVRTRKDARNPRGGFQFKWFIRPLVIVVVSIVLAAVQPFQVDRVDAGYTGFKINLSGDHRGVSAYEYKTGWFVYNTWTEDFRQFAISQQHVEYPVQQVITRGGFPCDIKPSFNYALIPGNVADMYQNLRQELKEVEQSWLKTAIVGSVNDIANRWEVDSIFTHRQAFEAMIIAECNKRVSKWFQLSQLRTNITPPPALVDAITAKTKAIQDAQAENQKAITAEATQRRKVAEANATAQEQITIAKGDSAAAVIRAAGEAEAIKRKQMTLTPLYVEYTKIERWNGVNPTTILGGGVSTLVNVK